MGIDSNGVNPSDWPQILSVVARNGGVIGKKTEYSNAGFSYKVFSSKDEMRDENYQKLSIREISQLSRENLGVLPTNENLKLKQNTYTLIANEKDKSYAKMNKINATWINAIKWLSIASVIFSPIGVLIHYKQKMESEDLQNKIKYLDAMTNPFRISDVEENLNLEFSTKERYSKELDDIADAINQKKGLETEFKGKEDYHRGMIKALFVSDEKFARMTKNSILEEIKGGSIVKQFKKDVNRDTTILVNGDVQEPYLSKSGIDLRKTEEVYDLDGHMKDIVKNLKTRLNLPDNESEKWSKVIQATCQQGTFFDISLLTTSDNKDRQWTDLDDSEHLLINKGISHFDVTIDRDNASNSIKKVTISVNTPIEIYDSINNGEKEIKVEQKNPLSYHLSLDLSFDDAGELQVDVTRREFTKS